DDVTDIGAGAYAGNLLRSVTIPASVERIREYAFERNLLNYIVIEGANVEFGDDAFGHNPGTLLVIGLEGSTAQSFAAYYGYEFITFGELLQSGDYYYLVRE